MGLQTCTFPNAPCLQLQPESWCAKLALTPSLLFLSFACPMFGHFPGSRHKLCHSRPLSSGCPDHALLGMGSLEDNSLMFSRQVQLAPLILVSTFMSLECGCILPSVTQGFRPSVMCSCGSHVLELGSSSWRTTRLLQTPNVSQKILRTIPGRNGL